MSEKFDSYYKQLRELNDKYLNGEYEDLEDKIDYLIDKSFLLLFTFLLGYVYTVLLVSQNNSYVYVDNYPLFLYSIIKRGKCLCYIACVFDKH